MAGFRRKVSPEERAARKAMFDDARANAGVEIREGRPFTVLRLPDHYGPDGPHGSRLRPDEKELLAQTEPSRTRH